MKTINKNMKNEKGLTLMEIAISLAVFSMVLVTSVYVLTSAHHLSVQSRERLLALNAARSAIETIKNTPLSGIQAINMAQFVPQGLRGGTITMVVNSDTGNVATATLATVTVAVVWIGPKNIQQRIDITTMRSRF